MPENDLPANNAAPEQKAAPDFEAIIRNWFNDHVANSLISREAPVHVLNDLTQRAIPALVAKLKGEG